MKVRAKKSTRTTHGSQALKTALCEAAHAASRTKTYIGSKFWSLAKRRGIHKATVATAHKLLVIIYHILLGEEDYKELGQDYLINRNKERVERRLVNQLEKLGYTVQRPAAV